MRYFSVWIVILFGNMFCCPTLQAQQSPQPLISGNFRNLNIEEFTEEIEKQTPYFFYYDKTQFDSFRVSITVERENLSSVLTRVFQNTDYNFSIGLDNEVYLTKFDQIDTVLTGTPPGNKKTKRNNAVNDANKNAAQAEYIQIAAMENKLYQIGINTNKNGQPNALLSGYIHDLKTGEPISGASVYVDKPRITVTTDPYGYYAITLPKGRWTLYVQSFGMKDTKRQINLLGDGKLNINLQGQVMMLKNVTVSAEKMSNIRGPQMGVQKLDIKTLKQVPVLFGETDLLRVLLTLPGVKSVGEASTGLNVRGGAAD